MKVNFKRVATAALAVAMSLSLNVPAFAAGNGGDRTLKVKGDTLDNKNVYAVQMFEAHVTSSEDNKHTFDSYELVNAESWLKFFNADTTAGGLGLTNADADDAREHVEKLTGNNLVTFADKAQAWVRKNSTDFTVIESDAEVPAVADEATFTDLQAGYYLVYPEGGSTGISRDTDAMLVNVPRDKNAELNIKSTFPTVDKKVDTNETEDDTHDDATANGSAQVGDTVTFILTSAVPDMSDYEDFYFAFNDTLTKGLAYVDESVEVTIGTVQNEALTRHYTVTPPTGESNLLKVEIEHLEDIDGIKVGDPIVVTYKAMITEDATTVDPATNEVKVVYSNDPTTNNKGESTPDISKVYTYDIDVNKWSSDMTTPNLAGAVFKLTRDEEGNNVVNLIATDETDSEDATDLHNAYRVAKPGEESEAGYTTTFTTDDDGNINIAGLEAGTYYLHEVKAPDGYNKLKAPVEIVIEITNMDTGAATIKVNDGNASGDGTTVDVENKKGIELPETGSIGTIGLTALGVVVVVAGLFAFPRKKKTRQD